jgi:hypothetical protein
MNAEDIPLKVLICDADRDTSISLERALMRDRRISVLGTAHTVGDAQVKIRGADLNTIFIDVAGLGIQRASDFVFAVRKSLPEVVFVLFIDQAKAEAARDVFYAGERSRFNHYYVLDKNTPLSRFEDEVATVVRTCRTDLSHRLSQVSLSRLAAEVRSPASPATARHPEVLANKIEELLNTLSRDQRRSTDPRSVFVSYRFEETEWISGLTDLLANSGFTAIDGKATNTYIGQGVIDRIRDSEYFLCLMTRYKAKEDGMYITSPWLLEEKGVALALKKRIVLMVEDGVDEIGGLQGDWQRIHFTQKGFLKAALAAVAQLRSYAGGEATSHLRGDASLKKHPASD